MSAGLLMTGCETASEKQPAVFDAAYKVAPGFDLELAASEPLIEAPVVMDFDNQGRMWVVEMRGYMPNLAGTGEDKPNGRISILEDLDKDGRADHVKVFMDSLVLPRAIAHVYGGLLYAAPPNLWFVEINNDKPGKRILVDSLYSDGGDIQAQPNGLMMGIDNWIYNANSTARYQRKGGKWIREAASFRGQWGITQDNCGRLYYNYNEVQLAGDYVLPHTFIDNPYLIPKAGLNKILTENQKVYPLHPTTVNRGYVKGILDKDSLLVNFTAACGPLVYRGDQFPEEYHQNIFVCEPEANLIKRNILSFGTLETTARQAWDDQEFIASTDEGFRPVNLLDGPDGAMYVVDMHRGIMEHSAFETPYYRYSIAAKKLDTLLVKGRILRVKYKNKKLGDVEDLDKLSGMGLAELLKSTNGWTRDRAQQSLIYQQEKSVIPVLQTMAGDTAHEVTAIHALHTLDGLNGLSFGLLEKVALSGKPMLTAHALLLLSQYATDDHIQPMSDLVRQLMTKKDSVTDLYLAVSLGPWATASAETFLPVLEQLSRRYVGSTLYQEAVINSVKGLEENLQSLIAQDGSDGGVDTVMSKLLSQTIRNKIAGKKNAIFAVVSVPTDKRTSGMVLFRSTCAVCHGVDGAGVEHVAPPLSGSAYVEGSTDRLGMIILKGLTGPLHVNGQGYTFNGSMPTFESNLSDRQIADIITYLHNSFVPGSRKAVKEAQIKSLRDKKMGILTEKELLGMDDTPD